MPRRASACEEHEDDLSRLLTRLDPDASRAQEKYVEMYRKLLRIFEWHGCLHPEEAADDTIKRVIRKLAENAGSERSASAACTTLLI
jgi:hypothetical protein